MCPPHSWDTPSIATFSFLIMGLPCTMTWNFAMAKAFVNYQPYSLQLGTGITCSQLVVQLLCAFVFTAGFNPLLYPQVLTCSSSPSSSFYADWLYVVQQHFWLYRAVLWIMLYTLMVECIHSQLWASDWQAFTRPDRYPEDSWSVCPVEKIYSVVFVLPFSTTANFCHICILCWYQR